MQTNPDEINADIAFVLWLAQFCSLLFLLKTRGLFAQVPGGTDADIRLTLLCLLL
ncbi:hypothetical protein [Nostoc sp.]|uniref:hypothetical protein n=1 Tax=Nostoc sp. TaxID=1180 RepID=UPI002FF7EB99